MTSQYVPCGRPVVKVAFRVLLSALMTMNPLLPLKNRKKNDVKDLLRIFATTGSANVYL